MYTNACDDTCGAQLSQEHDRIEFPIAFLSYTISDTQRKWSTTEQEAFVVCYAVTKWNYYLQGADIIVMNDHKLLAKFLNGKKHQQQSQQIRAGTSHLQHNLQMDIRSLEQTI